MNNKGLRRDKKESKSAEKKSAYRKNTITLLIPKNHHPPQTQHHLRPQSHQKSSSPYQIFDRSKTKSCLAGYIESNKISSDTIPLKKMSVSGWMEEQLTTLFVDKRNKNNYEYLNVIGKGGFGKVYKVKEKKTGQLFAMKEMSKAVILAKKSNQSILNERKLLNQIKHKFIVNMRQAFQDRDSLYLIMDLMPGGDLRYHICRKHQFTQEQTKFFAACVFIGLEHMHSQKIIHRDIKPENLVFDSKGYLHITDLGIAKQSRESNSCDTSGTPGYMAPQVMTKQNHSYEADYYALGVIVYELMVGKRPYTGRDRRSIRQQIMAKQIVIKKQQIPQGWSLQAADFVNKLIQRRPIMRLGWGGSHQLRNHSWLKDIPWQLLQNFQLDSPFRPYSRFNAQEVRYMATKQDEQMSNKIKQNKILLRKSTVQYLFQDYTFNEQQLSKFDQFHTTSSQLYKKKDSPFIKEK